MDLRQLEICQRRLQCSTPWVGGWLREAAVKKLIRDQSTSAIRILTKALALHWDFRIRRCIAMAFRRLDDAGAVNTFCAVWRESRHDALAALLCERGWIATAPLELRVLTALKTGQWQAIAGAGLPTIEPLFNAANDSDPEIASLALVVLGKIHARDAIELFCDLLIRSEHPLLQKLGIEKNFHPNDPGKRALFFFLTGQMERFEALDFDHRLLRAAYETAEPDLRHKISARVRLSGRPELANMLQGGTHKRQLVELKSREWESIVTVLRENRRYEDLWALVFETYPEWSVEALGFLKRAGFRPSNEADAAAFDKLCKLLPTEGKNLRLFLPSPICRAVFRMPTQGVRALTFSADGRMLATVCSDTTALLWDVSSRQLKEELSRRIGLVVVATYSPDGRTLAVGNVDNTSRIWDAATWQLRTSLIGHTDKISVLRFSPDNKTLATGSYDDTVRIWDLETAKCRVILSGHKGAVLTLAFSPDGQTIATGSHDETVRLWYTEGGASKATITGNLSSVCSLAFSPDGRTLATGSSDGMVRLWHVASGEVKAMFQGHNGSIMTLAFSPDGTRLATGSLDKKVRLWDLANGQPKANLEAHSDEVHALVFSPEGKILATGSRDKTARIWEIALTKPINAMTQDDLLQMQTLAGRQSSPEEARPWHFMTALLRHRFRFDIELGEIAGRVFSEFDIEIDETRCSVRSVAG